MNLLFLISWLIAGLIGTGINAYWENKERDLVITDLFYALLLVCFGYPLFIFTLITWLKEVGGKIIILKKRD